MVQFAAVRGWRIIAVSCSPPVGPDRYDLWHLSLDVDDVVASAAALISQPGVTCLISAVASEGIGLVSDWYNDDRIAAEGENGCFISRRSVRKLELERHPDAGRQIVASNLRPQQLHCSLDFSLAPQRRTKR